MRSAILGLLVLGLMPTAALADRRYDGRGGRGHYERHDSRGWHHDRGNWSFSLGFGFSDPYVYAPAYYPPPVVYRSPPAVYYDPPVVYGRAPVIVAPAPRYYYDRPRAYRFESRYYYRR